MPAAQPTRSAAIRARNSDSPAEPPGDLTEVRPNGYWRLREDEQENMRLLWERILDAAREQQIALVAAAELRASNAIERKPFVVKAKKIAGIVNRRTFKDAFWAVGFPMSAAGSATWRIRIDTFWLFTDVSREGFEYITNHIVTVQDPNRASGANRATYAVDPLSLQIHAAPGNDAAEIDVCRLISDDIRQREHKDVIPGALIDCEKEEMAAEHEPHNTTGAEAAAADQARPQRAFDQVASTRTASPVYPRWPGRNRKRYRPVVEEDENEDRGSKEIAPADSAPKAEDSDDYCEMVGEPRVVSGKSVSSTDDQSRGHSKPLDAGSGESHTCTTLDAQRLSLALETNKKLEEKVRELREALNEREKELQESHQAIKEREEHLMQKAESIKRYKRLVEELREEKQELSTKVDKLKDRLMEGN